MDKQSQPQVEVPPIQPGILTIFECEDQSLNIMTDPKSPYFLAPAIFKQIFEFDKEQKKVKIKKEEWKFEPKPTKTNICTYMFPTNSQYYTCKDCCNQSRPGVTMCYCQSCWVPEKHNGHNFSMRKTFGEGAYCDCGRQSAMKPESFCCSHENNVEQIPLEFNVQDYKQFIELFESLLLSYFYIKKNQQNKHLQPNYQQLFKKFIRERCEGSILYIRLCSYVLNKNLKIKDQQKTMLEWLLTLVTTCEKALFVLTADNIFKSQLYKAFEKCKKDGWKPQSNFRLIQAEFFMNDYLIYKLAKENIYVGKQKGLNKKYLQIATRSAQGINMLESYLNYEKQKHQLQGQDFIRFLQQFIDDKTNKSITSNKKIAKILLKNLLEETKKQSINSLTTQQGFNIISYVAVLSLCISEGNLLKLQQNVCSQMGQNSQQLLSQFLKFFIKRMNVFIITSAEQKQYFSTVMFALMKGLTNQDELVNLVWQKICQDDEDKRENFIEVINILHHLTTLIVNSAPILSAYTQAQDQKQKQKGEQELETWMKTYLCESEKMTKNQILSMREKGLFNFPNSGKLLKEMCKYDDGTEMFEYKSAERYSNYVMRFKVRKDLSSVKLKNVSKDRFRLSDSFQFQCPESIRQILSMIFTSKNFVTKFCNCWEVMVKKIKNEEQQIQFRKKYDIGFFYGIILVYANVFARGKNEQLLKQINKIRYSSQLRNQLTLLSINQNSVDLLLEVDKLPKEEQPLLKQQQNQQQKQNKQSSQNKEENIQDKVQEKKQEISSPKSQKKQQSSQKLIQSQRKKKLFQARKLKLKQKYKANAQNFLPQQAKKQKQNSSQSDQNQQVCIICHEGNANNHSIMYIAQLQKNSSISSFVHGLEDKSQVNISSCLHHIHSDCYSNINKNGFDFNCPLCSKRSNILLPINCKDKKSVNRCKNIINALEVSKFKNYDFNSLLMMLIKNLMGDYGLNALSFKPFYQLEKKRRRQTDKVILSLAKNYCENLSEFDRSQFEEEFKTLLQSISNCKKKQVIMVQKFFATLIYDKIHNKQIDLVKNDLLSEIYSNIVKDQYEIIKQNIAQIVHGQIQFPIAEQKDEQQKLSLGIKFLQLPETVEQFSNFKQKKCKICQKGAERVCGICKQFYCSKCSQQLTHKNQHTSGLIMIDLDKKKLLIKQTGGRINGYHNIYFDNFMSPYEDMDKYPNKQTYYLQQLKLQKIFTSFLLKV